MPNIDLGLMILRVLFGFLFAGHGSQKLFGWFGGAGMQKFKAGFEKSGPHPAWFWATIAALAEFLGGLGLAFGFLTPLAGAAIGAVMLVAIIRVHWRNGLWNTKGGIEFPLVNLFLAAFLGLYGPGSYSLDALFHIAYPRPLTFWVAAVVAFLGVMAAQASVQSLKVHQGHNDVKQA
jgi:putative oxidoreductase